MFLYRCKCIIPIIFYRNAEHGHSADLYMLEGRYEYDGKVNGYVVVSSDFVRVYGNTK